MATVTVGNASAITVPRADRDSIRKFYCDVLGGEIVKEVKDKDILRLDGNFYIVHRYADVPDASEFLRSSRALWLQLKTDNVGELSRKILDFGARKMELPSGLPASVPYLYFQAPGGQCFQLLPFDEDQSYYKGAADSSNAASLEAADAVKEQSMHELVSASLREDSH